MSTKRSIYWVCVVLLVVLSFGACSSDETRLKNDPVAVAKIRELNAKLSSGQQLSEDEFNSLKAEFEKYPAAEAVRQPYETALFLRKDWATLANFYKSLDGEDFTEMRRKNLAKVYVKLGKYKEASESAAKFDLKSDEEMRLVVVTSLYHMGKYDDAKKILDESWQAIESGKKPDEMIIRGMIYFYEGDNKKALETLEKVAAFDPLNVAANNSLSRVYSAEGETEKAEAALRKVQDSFDKLTEEERVKTNFVDKSTRLQQAYKEKRYEEVVTLGRELVPIAEPRNRVVIYQFLYNSYVALGKQKEAAEIMQEAKQFQQK